MKRILSLLVAGSLTAAAASAFAQDGTDASMRVNLRLRAQASAACANQTGRARDICLQHALNSSSSSAQTSSNGGTSAGAGVSGSQDAQTWWTLHCTDYFAAGNAYCAKPIGQLTDAQRRGLLESLLQALRKQRGAGASSASSTSIRSSTGSLMTSGGELWLGAQNQRLRYQSGRVQTSTDLQTWTDVENRAWMGSSSTGYKLDAAGNLWLSVDGGQTWTQSMSQSWQDASGRWYRLGSDGQVTTGQNASMQTGGGGSTRAQSLLTTRTPLASQRQAWDTCGTLSPRARSRCLQSYFRAAEESTTTTK